MMLLSIMYSDAYPMLISVLVKLLIFSNALFIELVVFSYSPGYVCGVPIIFEKPKFISKEVNETRLSDFATARVLQKFDFSWEKNNFRISVGKPVDEALGVKKTVFEGKLFCTRCIKEGVIDKSLIHGSVSSKIYHGAVLIRKINFTIGKFFLDYLCNVTSAPS